MPKKKKKIISQVKVKLLSTAVLGSPAVRVALIK